MTQYLEINLTKIIRPSFLSEKILNLLQELRDLNRREKKESQFNTQYYDRSGTSNQWGDKLFNECFYKNFKCYLKMDPYNTLSKQ